jgi:pyruvate/2-oxoglutarate dehydrogenase complex dihydrolipoamide acyltransferase (E2) component
MAEIKINEHLWGASVLPEGLVERWLVADGADVAAGDPIAEIRIEDALHEILAPAAGRLLIWTPINAVIAPGSPLGQVTP